LSVAIFDPPAEPQARKGAPVVVRPAIWVPALRVRPDISVAYAPPGFRLRAAGSTQARTDAMHDLIWIPPSADDGGEVHAGPEVIDLAAAPPAFAGSSFVLVVEAGVAGAAARPVFVPRADAVPDDRWSASLQRIGGQPQFGPGSLLFTLDGHFIGLAVPQDTGVAVVPPGMLNQLLSELTGPIK
jgi:hypothetical protein